MVRHHPPCVYTLCLHDVNSRGQAFPLHICILQVIKDWRRWERPGKEAMLLECKVWNCTLQSASPGVNTWLNHMTLLTRIKTLKILQDVGIVRSAKSIETR